MPPKQGRYKAATQRAWASWFESGRASLLDATGRANLERLIVIVDRAEREGWPTALTAEVRRQEAALLRARPAEAEPETEDARQVRLREERERSKERTRATLDGLDHTVWPTYEPDEGAGVTAGRYEMCLVEDEPDLTPAQRREVDRWNEKNDEAAR